MADVYVGDSSTATQILLGLKNPYMGAPMFALPAYVSITTGATSVYVNIGE